MKNDLAQIKKYLVEKDQYLTKILSLEIDFFWQPRPIYQALLETINYQQVSIHAGKALYKKFLDCFGGQIPTPQQLLNTDESTLKKASVSAPKIKYLYNIAEFALKNRLDNAYFDTLGDDEIITYLTQIKGIGVWTAQMLLMFDLGREDVFAPADIALHWTMKRIYPVLDEDIFAEHFSVYWENDKEKTNKILRKAINNKNMKDENYKKHLLKTLEESPEIIQEKKQKKQKALYQKFLQQKILEISAQWSPYRSWVCHWLWAYKEGGNK